jgi:hypothetical protein
MEGLRKNLAGIQGGHFGPSGIPNRVSRFEQNEQNRSRL